MTLIIATVLEDSAVLVTDGRRTLPFNAHADPEDSAVKIAHVGNLVAVGCLGVAQGTDIACELLAQAQTQLRDQQLDLGFVRPVAFGGILEKAMNRAWDALRAELEDVTKDSDKIRLGLVAVGFHPIEGPFIAAVLRGQRAPDPPVVTKTTLGYVVTGGAAATEAAARGDFTARLTMIGRWSQRGGGGPRGEKVRREVVRAAADVIAAAAEQDHSIGGQVQYAWVSSSGVDGGVYPFRDAPRPEG